jgi:hypothetical protein
MTSEVALMNRSAVVLAADSAATVKVWENGREMERYHKGANKIFNISTTEPVGLMIYDGADFQGTPWEVLVKSYRDARDGNSLDLLGGYPDDLFDFIVADPDAFPPERQGQQFLDFVVDAALRLARIVADNDTVKAEPDPAKKTPLKRVAFDGIRAAITGSDYFTAIDDAFVQANAPPHAAAAAQALAATSRFADVQDALTADEIVALAITAVFKKEWTTMSPSGLIFAGYGAKEYFPQLSHYRCFGLLFGRLVREKATPHSVSISHNNVSEIVPFARSDMMKTFMFGASPDALREIDSVVQQALTHYTDALNQNGLLTPGVAWVPYRDAAIQAFKQTTTNILWMSHTLPLKQVIGLFSIPELADLAEMLVRVESLKERVTKPTESVSGPVDVASISKSDGFVCIKRKHYFEASLNPRFFARKQLT